MSLRVFVLLAFMMMVGWFLGFASPFEQTSWFIVAGLGLASVVLAGWLRRARLLVPVAMSVAICIGALGGETLVYRLFSPATFWTHPGVVRLAWLGSVLLAAALVGWGTRRRGASLLVAMGKWAPVWLLRVIIGIGLALLIAVFYAPDVGRVPRLEAGLAQGLSPGNGTVLVLALVVLLEEVLFRGLLLSALVRRVDVRWALGMQALAFGMYSLRPFAAPAGTTAGLLGGAVAVVLGASAVGTGGLLVPVAAHLAWVFALVILV